MLISTFPELNTHTHTPYSLHLLTRDSISSGKKKTLSDSWFTSTFTAADVFRPPLETDPHTLILLQLSARLISSSSSYLHALITFKTDQWGGPGDEVLWEHAEMYQKPPFRTHWVRIIFLLTSSGYLHFVMTVLGSVWDIKKGLFTKKSGFEFSLMSLMDVLIHWNKITLYRICTKCVQAESIKISCRISMFE